MECPFIILVAHPDGGLLKLLAACWLYEEGLTEEVEVKRVAVPPHLPPCGRLDLGVQSAPP